MGFERVARVYGFVTMLPMPPDPQELVARATSVLQTVTLARAATLTSGMIALAPEGQDVSGQPDSVVGARTGEFIALLVKEGLPVLPVGVSQHTGRLRISIGPSSIPDIPFNRRERGLAVFKQVITDIARQLPGPVSKTA